MSEAVKSLLGRLGSLVPGYAGYADRERRRESDQALRLAVAARLGTARAVLDRRTAECARTSRFDVLEPLDALSRRVAALADAVRHAPAGYAALFDAATIGAARAGPALRLRPRRPGGVRAASWKSRSAFPPPWTSRPSSG